MKISMKRVAAFVLALVMVIGLVPVVNNTVNAAADFTNLTDKTLGVALTETTTGSVSTWSGVENTITGSLTGQKRTAKLYLAAKDTLTITNNKSSKAKLSFDYTTSGTFVTAKGTSSITISDEPAITTATSGSYSVDLEAGSSITIVLDVKQHNAGPNQININITNLSLTIVGGSAVDATFEAPAYGSYTVAYGDESVTVAAGTASQVISNMPSVKYTLTANPGEGYKFVGWYNVTTGTYLSTSASFNFSFEEAATVKAVIVPADSAVFLTGGNYYTDLNEAVAYATANSLTQITLVQSGTLAANDTGYTIPAGITLLIPMDADYTPTGFNEMGVAPEYTLDVVTPYSYVTLTLAEGAALTVNGTVDIESKHTTLQGAANKRIHGGRPSGAYGAIYMSPNSTITLNSGANLYAWGYVYGDGAITANSGAKVYEYMQVTDFPGGGNLSLFVDAALDADGNGDGIYDNDYIKSFPFSQYYVQNIEVALTLMAGATESVFTTVTVQAMSMGMPVEFVGNNGMFVPGTGSITKDYDPSTDRLIVEVNGDATVRGIVMDMSESDFAGAMEDIIGTSKFDSSRYILTLNSNITINVNSGTTTVAQDMALLPGVEIYVGKNATMRIAERTFADGEINNLTMYGSGGYNVYVYDLDQFENFVFQNQQLIPVSYSPTTGRYKRTVKDLKDAVIDIDGKLICDGFLYSTVVTSTETYEPISGGAAIISSGKTGSIVFQNGCGIEEFAFCLDGNSNVDNYVEVDSAWLLNGDGSYVKTVCDACAFFDDENYDCTHVGQIYNYCSVHDLWYTEGHELCGKAVEITWIINGNDETQEVDYNTVPVYLGNPTKPADGCTVYTFAGWAETANGEVLSQLPVATVSTTYFAVFTEGTSHLGDNNNDHTCDGCTDTLSECVDNNQDHICDYTGCGDTLSQCVDNNQDHYCDYLACLKPIDDCVDNNQDHICDYAGCGDITSECYDGNDKNHNCDYTGCNKPNVDTGCYGGTAYCNALAICDECGEQYGAFDAENHAGTATYYGNKTDKTHTVYYSCCDAVKAVEDHVYINGECDCNAKQTFIVKWESNGSVVETDVVEYGGTAKFDGATPTKTGNSFAGWEIDGKIYQIGDSITVKSNVTATATWTVNNYNITFRVNGVTSNVKSVPYGTQINQQWLLANGVCNVDGYQLQGWTVTYRVNQLPNNYYFTMPAQDFYADAILVINTYTVTWIVGDDAITEVYEYGTVPSFKGSTDKAQDGCTIFTFDGWDKDIVAVTGNVTYTAQYTTSTSHIGDTDNDHFCNGCNGELSKCVDNDGDHLCDYVKCDEKLSDCVDNDEDHYCDYAKCDEKLSDCVDGNDDDHNCDYVGCGKENVDGGHHGGTAYCNALAICDECGERYGEFDADNHNRDGFYEAEAGNKHHFYYSCCDTSDQSVPCSDKEDDGDHKCDFCPNENITGHSYDDATHKCECDAVEQITVKVFWDGQLRWTLTEDYGTTTTIPTGLTPAGYHFVGFAKTEGGEVFLDKDAIYTYTQSIELHPVFEKSTYTLTVETVNENVELTVPYGANLLEVLAQAAAEGKIPAEGDRLRVNDEKTNGEYYIVGSYYFVPSYSFVENNSTMPAENVTLLQGSYTYGWTMVDTDGDYAVDSWQFFDPEKGQLGEGWHYIEENYDDVPGGAWYYFESCAFSAARVEGISRVPYNTELGYGPDQAAMDYCANNGTTFIDATKGWFVFDENGKFQSNYTGVVIDGEYARYAVNGHIAWHVGLIENQGAYFYFTGDEVNGGNVMVAGRDYYLSRNNTELNVTIGGIYTFGVDGALCRFHGITENDLFEGKRYYVGGQLMIGAGLLDIYTVATGITNYFYVDAYGQLIVDAEYYVGGNSLGINSGIYYFDENGFMVIPEENGWNGFYNVDGTWYYYENGEKAYCAGLICTTGILWYENADAEGVENQGWVYVKSNGALATGEYYVTNVGDGAIIGIASGDLCLFGNDGLLQQNRNGIVDGYYYVDNKIAYAAGLIEIDGDYYYVRSNGQIVTGRRYWVTNVNETGIEPAEYEFDEDGKLVFPEVDTFTGIRDGKYFVNGHTAYGAGLIQIDGKYYYVRSNGQLATGKYWITNTNGEMAEGYYNFGEDGVLVSE